MVQLRQDCLIFQTSHEQNIPCSAEVVTIELVSNSDIDPEVVREAALATALYFRDELKREVVTVEEFSRALIRVLHKLGIVMTEAPKSPPSLLSPEWLGLFCEIEEAVK